MYLFYYILYLHLFTQNLYAHFWSFFAAMFIHLFRRFFGPTNAALQPLAFPIGTNKIHQGFFPRAQQCSKPMLGDELALGQCPNLPLICWGLSQFSWAIHGYPLRVLMTAHRFFSNQTVSDLASIRVSQVAAKCMVDHHFHTIPLRYSIMAGRSPN